jgi:hypothetical protein
MSLRLRKEEYAPMSDFIRVSFVNNQPAFLARYPKMDAAYLAEFDAKTKKVKTLESGLVLTEAQKNATASLYAEASALNTELNFLTTYMKDSKLNTALVSDLKKDLRSYNFEGAVLKIQSIKQYIVANAKVLIEEGMLASFPETLAAHELSLAQNNVLQNEFLNAHKKLVDANGQDFKDLYGFITKIARNGKLIFNNTITKDEFTMSKMMGKLRVVPAKKVVPPAV